MQIKRLFFPIIIFLVLISFFLFTQRKANVTGTAPADHLPPESHAQDELKKTNVSVAPVNATPSAGKNLKNKTERIKEALSEFNDADIFFHGKIIDQFGAVVPQASIVATVSVNNGKRIGGDKISLFTDKDGLFTIKGYKGKWLGLQIAKDGYVMSTTSTLFVYSLLWPEAERFKPDPERPELIKMWKLQGAEPLVAFRQRYKLHLSEMPANFDLITGKITPSGGDLRITINRPEGEVSGRNQQDWSVKIEAVNGGLIEASLGDSRMIYELPATNYSGDYSYAMSTNTRTWRDGLGRFFYMRGRDGQFFSKLNLGITINAKPNDYVSVELDGTLNPHGSRNFEEDAKAMIIKSP